MAPTHTLMVKLLSGESHSVPARESMSVSDFKKEIALRTGIPPSQQKLGSQNGTFVELRDGTQLSDYALAPGDTVLLMVKAEEPMEVFVRSNGRSKLYTVRPSDNVTELKAQVQQREGVRQEQFWLSYQEANLQDGHSLAEYLLVPHCTIDLNLRVRGGGRAGGT
ncbi:ubiquitin-like protein ISG15 [Ornithorhynchus anatinus]|uniref:ISG15 ubiquitin like modifier n=1 Tax=Ornithorhynchus anatinus TaxID=9258 RepID=A0A6I8NFQ8_ORNAN|nr:ubiquitin-like protein ISG15 [Ornithorhynchus anatinus]